MSDNSAKYAYAPVACYWQLVLDCALRFGTLIPFAVEAQTEYLVLRFFVPEDHALSYEICTYLEHEIHAFECPPLHSEDGSAVIIQGLRCEVLRFDGIDPHLPRDVIEQMTRNFVSELKQRFKHRLKGRPAPEKEVDDDSSCMP